MNITEKRVSKKEKYYKRFFKGYFNERFCKL